MEAGGPSDPRAFLHPRPTELTTHIEIAGLYINPVHLAFVRREEHSQHGPVLAIDFAASLYAGERHHDELRGLLVDRDVTGWGRPLCRSARLHAPIA